MSQKPAKEFWSRHCELKFIRTFFGLKSYSLVCLFQVLNTLAMSGKMSLLVFFPSGGVLCHQKSCWQNARTWSWFILRSLCEDWVTAQRITMCQPTHVQEPRAYGWASSRKWRPTINLAGMKASCTVLPRTRVVLCRKQAARRPPHFCSGRDRFYCNWCVVRTTLLEISLTAICLSQVCQVTYTSLVLGPAQLKGSPHRQARQAPGVVGFYNSDVVHHQIAIINDFVIIATSGPPIMHPTETSWCEPRKHTETVLLLFGTQSQQGHISSDRLLCFVQMERTFLTAKAIFPANVTFSFLQCWAGLRFSANN